MAVLQITISWVNQSTAMQLILFLSDPLFTDPHLPKIGGKFTISVYFIEAGTSTLPINVLYTVRGSSP